MDVADPLQQSMGVPCFVSLPEISRTWQTFLLTFQSAHITLTILTKVGTSTLWLAAAALSFSVQAQQCP